MATNRSLSTQIEGLPELQRALRAMDDKMPRELRKVNLEVAKQVTERAKSKATGISKGGQRLERAIFAVAQQRSAGIQIRDAVGRTAGALGYEFGAGRETMRTRKTGKYVGYRQFDEWRGSGEGAGYAVYPAVRAEAPQMPERYARALDPLLRQAFPD